MILLQEVFARIRSVATKLPRNTKLWSGTILLLATCIISLTYLSIVPTERIIRAGLAPPNQPPSWEHPLGTDSMGRDLLAQVPLSIVNSLEIGLIVALIGTVVGAIVGFFAGYYGGAPDTILRTSADIFITIPMLPLLILVASFLKVVHVWMTALILSIPSWAWPARQIRAQILSLKERDFVYIAELSGMNRSEIIFSELMPHMAQYMFANFIYAIIWAILAEAGISILGLGPQHTMTIGMMIYWAISYVALVRGLWWWIFTPIAMLIWIIVCLYLIYTGLDEVINPRLKGE